MNWSIENTYDTIMMKIEQNLKLFTLKVIQKSLMVSLIILLCYLWYELINWPIENTYDTIMMKIEQNL